MAVVVLEILIGAALMVLAAIYLRRRPPASGTGLPRWLAAVDSFGPVVCFSIAVVLSLASLIAPQRMEPKLISARDWLIVNGRIVTSVMMFMIGVVILGYGLTQL
jgi:hypothetical protein